ncbi:hypothetical protein EV193_101352 [Herbihabitans rhizosphaerae]|uniref:PE family protein n=1 Tax=Herbihabitans rhizosphaerae TaxID=1872711 RepID=A0A4Q7L5G1_9PSEU|nr:hypothetical protein [Herbihabitans rhizosphaerae]RZS44476.1 hypothetical protein EV193_101352 [Herbihabitans rhizosphaerae]
MINSWDNPQWEARRKQAEQEVRQAYLGYQAYMNGQAPPPVYSSPGLGKHVFADLAHLDHVIGKADLVVQALKGRVQNFQVAHDMIRPPAADEDSRAHAEEFKKAALRGKEHARGMHRFAEHRFNQLRAARTQLAEVERANAEKMRRAGPRDA